MSRLPKAGLTILALSSLLFLGPAAQAAKIKGTWIEITSEHFVVISNARPKQAKKVAAHFEQIHHLMTREMPRLTQTSGQRLKIFAPADSSSMKLLLPIYWADRGRTKPAGVFSRSPSDRLIVVQADLVGGDSFDVVYHEYFHFLANNAGLKLPTWLSEGLADYWGAGSRLTKKHAEVGRPISYRLREIQGVKFLPFEDLFGADRTSAIYRDSRASLFYAQSWALTHLIQIGDPDGELRQGLIQYLTLVGQGQESVAAAKEAFGDFDKLRLRLKTYLRQLTFNYGKLPPVPKYNTKALKIEELSDARVASYLARYLHSGRTRQQTQELLAMAAAQDSDSVVTLEAQGQFAISQGEISQALEAFTKAAAKPESTAMSHYGLAVSQFHDLRNNGSLDAESLHKIGQRLIQAIQVNDQFAPAFSRLAEIYSRLDDGPSARALTAIRRAVLLQPDHMDYRLKEAEILLQSGDPAAAFQVARAEAQQYIQEGRADRCNSVCWSGSLMGMAEAVLPACERAVELDPESFSILDSRAVARILVADYQGAMADLKKALELGKKAWDEDSKATRQAWIAALEKQKSPFPEGYKSLAEDVSENGLGWLR